MSDILIEKYRSYDIKFSTDKETFYASSLQLDNEQEKKSYASIKKAIDDFIKENNEFKPFWIDYQMLWYRSNKKINSI